MLKYNPDTLVNYSTQAYGDYVRSLCKQWMPYFKPQKSFDMVYVENACEKLHDMLVCTLLPSKAANDVTLKLLRQIDILFDINSFKKFTVDDELILSSVTSVLIHPSVTELNLQDSYYEYFYMWVMDHYVQKNLSQLRFLKVLNVGVFSFQEITSMPSQNLQELTFCGTFIDPQNIKSNALLQQFSNSSHNLRKIKIQNCSIDDVGLKILLKFTRLKDLEFERIHGFSAKGMTELLEGLAKNTDDTGTPLLKHFKYFNLNPEQLDFAVHSFHLLSFCVKDPVKHMHYMSHLKSLCIHGTDSTIQEALRVVGHQLSHLELICLDGVDLLVVAECCPVLVSLKMLCITADILNDCDVSLPSFSNLKIVNVRSYFPKLIMCILTYCTNVKVLKLNYRSQFANADIVEVLQKNSLRHVEELEVTVLLSNLDIEILKHCQIMHSYFWRSQKNSQNSNKTYYCS